MPGRTRSRPVPTTTSVAIFDRYTPYREHRQLGSFISSSGSEVMLDWVTEDYHKRIKNGDLINNNMSYSKKSFVSSGSGAASYSSIVGNSSFSISGAVTAYRLSGAGVADIPGPPLSVFEGLVKDARSACIANMNSATVAIGEDLKEVDKTCRLLRNPVEGISRNLNRVARDYARRPKKDTAKSFAKFLADYWVQYRFAFTPLVKSMENILIEANKTVPPNYSKIEKSHGRKYWEFRNSRNVDASQSLFKQDITVNMKVHAYAAYKLSGASNFGNGRRWGSRLRDWPDRTWQVMPYSFMVDRLYNVSNVINGIVNLVDPNVSVLTAGNTYKIETVRSVTYIADTNPAYTSSVSGETLTTREFSYNREQWAPDIADVFPVPNVSNVVNSATKVADLTSLILQRLVK